MGFKHYTKTFIIFVIVDVAVLLLYMAFYRTPRQLRVEPTIHTWKIYSKYFQVATRKPGKRLPAHTSKTQSYQKLERSIKIVFYRPYHGGMKWHIKGLDMQSCQYSNCKVGFAKASNEVIDADAVLFQANHIPPVLPRRRDKDQVFVFTAVEAPQYLNQVRLYRLQWYGFFNWTMTYRLDSDLPYLYGAVVDRTNSSKYFPKVAESVKTIKAYDDKVIQSMEHTSKNYTEIFQKKSTSAVWLVSHCTTASRRELYVKQMQKYLDIDTFGSCTGNRMNCQRDTDKCDNNIVMKYKFYLAFENSMCADYITEKVYKWFNKDIVLVVRGARFYDLLLPAGTYINTDDFESAEHLSKYLTRLGANQSEYISILKRKDQFMTVSEQTCAQNAYCALCNRLNNLERFRKTVWGISQWWERGGVCIHSADL